MAYEMIEEDEVDLREVMRTIWRYRWSILLMALLVTLLAAIYAYYTPNTYQSAATLEIGEDSKGGMGSGDLLQAALSGGTSSGSIDTEKAIIQSRFVVLEAMKKVNIAWQVQGWNALYKKIELFSDIPFEIHLEKGHDATFTLRPGNNDTFELEAKGKDPLTGEKFEYDGRHRFGQTVKHRHFALTLVRTQAPIRYEKYTFAVYRENYFAESLREKKISVSQIGKKANVIKISYSDPDPLRAQLFVNALADAYMEQNIRRKTIEAAQTLKFVNKQLAIIETGMQTSAQKLEAFKKKNKTVDVSQSAEQLVKTLADYDQQLGITKMQVDLLKSLSHKVKKGKNLETLTLAGAGIEDTSLARLTGELQKAILTQKRPPQRVQTRLS
jgi:uncharacterized protein involved in exopolysaccharide biosynthesis